MAEPGSEQKKRKFAETEEIEIDVSAPEPPSKKALRKAKKEKSSKKSSSTATTETTTTNGDEPEETTTTTAPSKTDDKPTNPNIEAKRSEYGVWVGNLPFSATKEQLRDFITSNSTIEENDITRIHMPSGPKFMGRPQIKGFAYVDFTTADAVQHAIFLSEKLMTGRRLLIKDAKNFQGRPDKSAQEAAAAAAGTPAGAGVAAAAASGKAPSQRVFVGNLAFETTKEDLEELFAPCGNIADVHVATFEDSGKCKGYAWVQFESLDAAEAAVRGWVNLPVDGADDDEEPKEQGLDEAESSKPAKKVKTRRRWVNRIQGRQLKAEYAEDKATRYKKRFGKEGTAKPRGVQKDAIVEVDDKGGRASGKSQRREGGRKDASAPPVESRYDEATVQRLSGAIVAAKGKKMTFE